MGAAALVGCVLKDYTPPHQVNEETWFILSDIREYLLISQLSQMMHGKMATKKRLSWFSRIV